MGSTVTNQQKDKLREALIEGGFDPDVIGDFIINNLAENRSTDKLYKKELGLEEFYKREKEYSQLELFALHLK